MTLSQAQISYTQQQIINWQAAHGRHDLPWQYQITPYRVHVSEIMLQQTQVSTVIPFFKRWMERFPDLATLAAASEDEVMVLWQGLGYYSRARNLRKAAQYLFSEHAGKYPADIKTLNAIPGVGRYTAGAICSFAFNRYGPIVDGNVKRLYARYFAVDGEPNSSAFTKQMWQLAEALTPADNSQAYSQGVLDLGATLCTKSSPDCNRCPIATDCQALIQERVHSLPNPKKRKPKPIKDGHFIWHTSEQALWLVKRPSPGIWGGLWCLPEHTDAPADTTLIGEFTHQFTHYTLNAKVWRATPVAHQVQSPQTEYGTGGKFVALTQLNETGLPKPIRNFVDDILTIAGNK